MSTIYNPDNINNNINNNDNNSNNNSNNKEPISSKKLMRINANSKVFHSINSTLSNIDLVPKLTNNDRKRIKNDLSIGINDDDDDDNDRKIVKNELNVDNNDIDSNDDDDDNDTVNNNINLNDYGHDYDECVGDIMANLVYYEEDLLSSRSNKRSKYAHLLTQSESCSLRRAVPSLHPRGENTLKTLPKHRNSLTAVAGGYTALEEELYEGDGNLGIKKCLIIFFKINICLFIYFHIL
jgi:hypothetical protein